MKKAEHEKLKETQRALRKVHKTIVITETPTDTFDIQNFGSMWQFMQTFKTILSPFPSQPFLDDSLTQNIGFIYRTLKIDFGSKLSMKQTSFFSFLDQ